MAGLPAPGPAQALLGGIHPKSRFTDTFWRLCRQAPGDEPWEVVRWVRQAMHNPGMACRWVAGIEAATRAQVVHIIAAATSTGSGRGTTASWPPPSPRSSSPADAPR